MALRWPDGIFSFRSFLLRSGLPPGENREQFFDFAPLPHGQGRKKSQSRFFGIEISLLCANLRLMKQKLNVIVPFPAARRARKRVGGPLADMRAEELRARFQKVSEASRTGDATTPLKKLLKRF